MNRRDLCTIGIIFIFVTFVLIVTGILMTLYYEKENRQTVYKGARLTLGSGGLNAWQSSGEERKETIHVFHVTNPEEVVRFGQSIRVEEKGPFVYRVREMKTNVTLDERNDSLSYHLKKFYTFDRDSSGGRSERDIVTIVNFPILSLISKLRLNASREAVDELAMSNETLFANVSVADLLWGITNDALDRINDKFRLFNDTTIGILHQTGVLNHTRYMRDMGYYTVSTGTQDLSSVWNIKQWNHQTKLTNWKSTSSNAIKGTSGYAWHPFLDSSVSLDTFDSDWCRSIYTSYEGQSSVERLSAGRYVLPSSVLDTTRPENVGFCEETPDGKSCLTSGLLNITSCNTDRIPWILSQPCFYQADVSLARAIDNLPTANKDKHETSLDVEMVSGEVITSRSRKQFNVFVKNETDLFNETTNIRTPIVIPVAWLEEEYSMARSEKLRLEVLAFRRYSNSRTRNGVIGLGVVLLAIVCFVLIISFVKMTKSQSHSEWQPIPTYN